MNNNTTDSLGIQVDDPIYGFLKEGNKGRTAIGKNTFIITKTTVKNSELYVIKIIF